MNTNDIMSQIELNKADTINYIASIFYIFCYIGNKLAVLTFLVGKPKLDFILIIVIEI